MRHKKIADCLAKARHFRALANPETNHLQATSLSTMLPDKARARAEYWEAMAQELLAEGIARQARRKRRPRKNPKN
jgi:CRISPR/Cas system-associated endonuclease Cas1